MKSILKNFATSTLFLGTFIVPAASVFASPNPSDVEVQTRLSYASAKQSIETKLTAKLPKDGHWVSLAAQPLLHAKLMLMGRLQDVQAQNLTVAYMLVDTDSNRIISAPVMKFVNHQKAEIKQDDGQGEKVELSVSGDSGKK